MTTALETPSTRPKPAPRPLFRRALHVVRRGHLYLGLFLFPWAVLYGVTAFLFNHPTLFADGQSAHYTRADLAGTPLEAPPTPEAQADAVIAALNERQSPAVTYRSQPGHTRYSGRETFVAMVRADRRTFSVTYDPATGSGLIRETTPPGSDDPAPFAAGIPGSGGGRGSGMGGPRGMGKGPMRPQAGGVPLPDSLPDRIKASIPTLLERKGFPPGDVTVTQSPDLKFPIEADGRIWTATYNPLTTAVSGVAGVDQGEFGARSFLTRLHLSRGYPGELNVRWVWAVGVDAMAVVLCFWGVSGLFMWWQIKATRKAGLVVLALSAVAATALGVGMYTVLAA